MAIAVAEEVVLTPVAVPRSIASQNLRGWGLMLGGAVLLAVVLYVTYAPRTCQIIAALPWLRC